MRFKAQIKSASSSAGSSPAHRRSSPRWLPQSLQPQFASGVERNGHFLLAQDLQTEREAPHANPVASRGPGEDDRVFGLSLCSQPERSGGEKVTGCPSNKKMMTVDGVPADEIKNEAHGATQRRSKACRVSETKCSCEVQTHDSSAVLTVHAAVPAPPRRGLCSAFSRAAARR